MAVNLINTDHHLGFHISKCYPSLLRTFKSYLGLPFRCFQIYLSTRSWELPKYSNIDLLQTRKLLQDHQMYLCIHGSYLYNLCGSAKYKKEPRFNFLLRRTQECLTQELDLGVALGAGVVVHPGSCVKKEEGLQTIAESVTHCLTVSTPTSRSLAKDMGISFEEFIKQRKIILENASGGGTKLAVTLEEIASIIQRVPKELHPQIKVCIDTAHSFGAGLYHWGKPKEVEKFYSDFDRVIGLSFLELFHLNDSRKSDKKRLNAFFGSGKDVHEYLGYGYIFEGDGIEGLQKFLLEAHKRKLFVIGEPPQKDRNGNPGRGGLQEWPFIAGILSNTNHPLLY